MSLSVKDTQITIKNLRTRMPFAFGSITLRELPHAFVELTVIIDSESEVGIAADHVVPKWFRKDSDKTIEDDIEDILIATERACAFAEDTSARTAFEFWRQVHDKQKEWATKRGLPPLLANFGVSFVERGVIDAVCRLEGISFAEAVHENAFKIKPGSIYPETDGMKPADVLPANPRQSIAVRHTVGMTDPLTEDDLDSPIDDGLPESLEKYIEVDGIRYAKCKLNGNSDADVERLEQIAEVLDRELPDYGVTLDANEQYRSINDLKKFWAEITSKPSLESFVENLICIEQPLPRELAFSIEARKMLNDWDGPPIIIDESDGAVDAFKTALDLGYHGTSVKSCKGVFKAIVNACLADHRRSVDGRPLLLTGEDLTTIGPVSLQEDLALMATLGFEHVERNGHHYFRGADMYSTDVQDQLNESHGDLYCRHREGFVTLDIDEGELQLNTVLSAPYGRAVDIDPSRFTPVTEWSVDSLGLER